MLLLFSMFNPPAVQFYPPSTLFSIVQGSIFPTVRVPLRVKILYSLGDEPPMEMQGIIVRVGGTIRLTDRNGNADFLVAPGNHSVLVIWARSRLRSWSQYVLVDRPLELIAVFREMRVAIRAVEIWSNASSTFSKVMLTYQAPVGDAVYAAEPFLYYLDTEGKAGAHPASLGGDTPLFYYLPLTPGDIHDISINIPSAVSLVLHTRSFVPLQVVNSTIREATPGVD